MVDVLSRFVKKLIVPEYPWIKDFVWKTKYIGNAKFYDLILFVDNRYYSDNAHILQKRNPSSAIYEKIYQDTRMLFNMVIFEENNLFGNVYFAALRDRDNE